MIDGFKWAVITNESSGRKKKEGFKCQRSFSQADLKSQFLFAVGASADCFPKRFALCQHAPLIALPPWEPLGYELAVWWLRSNAQCFLLCKLWVPSFSKQQGSFQAFRELYSSLREIVSTFSSGNKCSLNFTDKKPSSLAARTTNLILPIWVGAIPVSPIKLVKLHQKVFLLSP